MDILIGIILIAAAAFLVVAVLMQSGKDKSLSGTIAGGSAETFYGKNKGNSNEQKLSRLTTVIAIVFVVIVLISFIVQDDGDIENLNDLLKEQATATESTTTEPAASSSEVSSSEVVTTDAVTTDAVTTAPVGTDNN